AHRLPDDGGHDAANQGRTELHPGVGNETVGEGEGQGHEHEGGNGPGKLQHDAAEWHDAQRAREDVGIDIGGDADRQEQQQGADDDGKQVFAYPIGEAPSLCHRPDEVTRHLDLLHHVEHGVEQHAQTHEAEHVDANVLDKVDDV